MKQRIYELCEALNITPNAFSISLGLCRTFVKSMSGTTSATNVGKILSTYPQVNPYWLILGQGEMFIDHHEVNTDYRDLYLVTKKDNDDLRRDNQRLRNELHTYLTSKLQENKSSNG